MKNIMSILDFVSDTTEPPEPIIGNGILLPETLLTVIGPPKVGKSFLVFNLASAMMNGTGFACFEIIKPHRVMILSAEGGFFPNRNRMRRITKGINQNILAQSYFSSHYRLFIDNETHYSKIQNIISELEIDVLVIDPLIRFHQQDENSSTGMSKVMGLIRELIYMTNVSVILVHHTGKQVNRGGRGSSVITGEYDSAIYMERERNGGIQLRFDTRHVETPNNVILQFNPDSFWFEEAKASTGEHENKVVTHLKQNGTMKKSKLVNELVKDNIGVQSSIYRWIDSALNTEKIRENNGMLESVN